MFNMSGCVVMITGSVGNLGLSTAQTFQGAGARTVLVDRSIERLRNMYAEVADSPDHYLIGDVDLTDPEAFKQVAQQTVDRFGRLDVLINTVGAFRSGKLVHEEEQETWDFLFKVNFTTTLNSCQAVIPHMIRQQKGRIVNTLSPNAFVGAAGAGAYSVAKSAVLRLTESMAGELKEFGVNVNAVVPGTMDTPQNRQAMPNEDHSKWVAPGAVADVFLFLASEGARAITGTAVPVYGKA